MLHFLSVHLISLSIFFAKSISIYGLGRGVHFWSLHAGQWWSGLFLIMVLRVARKKIWLESSGWMTSWAVSFGVWILSTNLGLSPGSQRGHSHTTSPKSAGVISHHIPHPKVLESWSMSPNTTICSASKHDWRMIYWRKVKQGGKPSIMAVKRRKTTFVYSWWHWGFVWRHKFPQTVMCGSYYSVWTVNGITYVDHIIFKTPTSGAKFRYVYIIQSLTNNQPYDCNSFLTVIHSLAAKLLWVFKYSWPQTFFYNRDIKSGCCNCFRKISFPSCPFVDSHICSATLRS